MSLHLDYAEISRQARRIVDANRARSVLQQQQEMQAAEDGEAPRKRVKYTRSTRGCLQCRSHKVKCDETTPICLRCVASQRACEYPAPRGEKKRTRGKSTSQSGEGTGTAETAGTAGAADSSLGILAGLSVDALGADEQGGFSTSVLGKEERTSPKQLSPSDVFNMTPAAAPSVSPHENAFATPDLSFLNDLIPGLDAFASASNTNSTGGPSTPNLFYPHTSPTSTLPVNWGLPASMPRPTPSIPQIANLPKSTLLTRRVGKGKEVGTVEPGSLHSTPVPTLPPRLAQIESILQRVRQPWILGLADPRAYGSDETLFEFGPSHRQRALSSAGLNTTTDIFSNAFPSNTSRTLFNHYCNDTCRILATMGNVGPNPLLAICTPHRLLDTNSAASAAMRMSILSTSVAHYAHETELHLPPSDLPNSWKDQKRRLKEMSHKFKRAALANILLGAVSDNGRDQTDNLLAACTLLTVRDVLTADPGWKDNMEFVLNFIGKRGGPQAMLKDEEYSFTRRYLLENLAAHDVFSYFTTGKEPQLLGNYDSWWFDSVERSTTRWEWESVERTFGVSRAMVDLVARITVLDSHKRRLGISLKGHPDELWDAGQHFIRESHCLLLELDIWGNSLNALPQHFRVTCGDYIYKYMAVIYILGEILEQDTSTPRIVSAVSHVLELLSEASAMRMCVMLIWPLMIAGMFCLEEHREKVRSLFDAYQPDYSEDLETARELLEAQWGGMDSGIGRRTWTEVMKQLDKPVMLI